MVAAVCWGMVLLLGYPEARARLPAEMRRSPGPSSGIDPTVEHSPAWMALHPVPQPTLLAKLGLGVVAETLASELYTELALPLDTHPYGRRPGDEQDSSGHVEGPFPSADDPPVLSLRRRLLAALPMLSLYAGVATWAYFAWYYKQPRNRRLVFNSALEEGFGPHTYAGGADKLGHFFATYIFARLGSRILIDRGWPRSWAVVLNVSFTLALYTMVEVRDGLHPGYGFSGPDYAANVLGAGVAALLLLVPALDNLFDVRMRYIPSRGFRRQLVEEGDIDFSEDYTGETVMLAFHLGGVSAIRRSPVLSLLRYVDLLVGYNARGFLPRPDPSILRKQEVFFGFSLNLAEVLRDLYPDGRPMGWAAKGLMALCEYIQLTPVKKSVAMVWRTPQPDGVGQ